MKQFVVPIVCAAIIAGATVAKGAATKVEHKQFQAVHENGDSSFDDTGPTRVVLEGIVLNSPELFLDPAADDTVAPWFMGGQWQIYVQGEGDDHAGTALWMGQNYANGPGWESYTNQQWRAETCRLNHDPNTDYVFGPGDRVRVTGRYLFYKGKLNINENHEIGPNFDFTVELVEPAAGSPQPEVVGLSELKDPQDREIFDPTRMTGCEYYQSCLIRVNDVTVVDPENWGIDSTITVRDETGLTLPVRLGRGRGIAKYDCPTGQIDVVGILDQEAPGQPPAIDNTKGYRLFVLDYDGNGLVLTHRGHRRANLPGDTNGDFKVDMWDLAQIAADWLACVDGLCHCGN